MRRFGEAHQSTECAVKRVHHSAEVALRGRVKRSRSAKARGFRKVQRLRDRSAMRDRTPSSETEGECYGTDCGPQDLPSPATQGTPDSRVQPTLSIPENAA